MPVLSPISLQTLQINKDLMLKHGDIEHEFDVFECAAPAFAQAPPATTAEPPSDVANEFRITAYPSYRINDDWSGFGYVGWVSKPDADYTSYYLGKGFFYSPKKWVQVWGVRRPCLDGQHLSPELQTVDPERGILVAGRGHG